MADPCELGCRPQRSKCIVWRAVRVRLTAPERLLGAPEALDGEDEVPDTPETRVSRAGDLWPLGRHRLLCGDATASADVNRLLGEVPPHLMVTDPPYGVEYDPAWRNDSGVSQTRRTGKVLNDDRADWRDACSTTAAWAKLSISLSWARALLWLHQRPAAHLLRNGAQPGVRRCRRSTLAAADRRGSYARG